MSDQQQKYDVTFCATPTGPCVEAKGDTVSEVAKGLAIGVGAMALGATLVWGIGQLVSGGGSRRRR